MVGCSRGSLPTWMTAFASRVDLPGGAASPHQGASPPPSPSSSSQAPLAGTDHELGMAERALSAAGAAFVSAVIVNPLDVAKTRLQAQAAGVLYSHPPQMAALGPDAILSEFRCSPSCTRGIILGSEPVCPPDCFQYKGTLDVFLKVVRQEGFGRLWRGTNAGLALAVPTNLQMQNRGEGGGSSHMTTSPEQRREDHRSSEFTLLQGSRRRRRGWPGSSRARWPGFSGRGGWEPGIQMRRAGLDGRARKLLRAGANGGYRVEHAGNGGRLVSGGSARAKRSFPPPKSVVRQPPPRA